jgi:DNA-binding response OmpR family regulator
LPTVFVISEDWALRAPLRAELLEQGIEALGFDCVDDALHAAADGHWPALVVADDAALDAGRPELATLLQRSGLLVITSGAGDATAPPSGAATLRRPVRVGEITARVRQMLEGQPA